MAPPTNRSTKARLANNPDSAFAECLYSIRKLQAYFHAGDYASAIEAASRAQRHTASGLLFQVADFHFYSALAHAALCDAADQREQHAAALTAHHRQLQVWGENCPENFANRAALVGAEIARLEGRQLDAERLYRHFSDSLSGLPECKPCAFAIFPISPRFSLRRLATYFCAEK